MTIKAKAIFPILTILFLGFLGFSVALPILPPLILDPDALFLPVETSDIWRNFALGLLLAMYPAGQFFGCPIIGRFSDRYGRKKILLISIAAIIPIYVATALAIDHSLIALLYIGRFLAGLLEGNIVIAQAAMTDISETTQEKSRLFSWGVAATSSAFIIGPMIGGKLADPTLVSWFSYSTPFWLASVLFALTFVYMAFQFQETTEANRDVDINVWRLLRSLYRGVKQPVIRAIYGMNLVVYMAVFFFFGFLPVFLIKKFGMPASRLAEAEAYLSVPIAIASFFEGQLSRRFSPIRATVYSSLLLGAGMLLVIPFPSKLALLFTLIPPGLAIAWVLTYTTVMVSENVPEDIQGEALGINQSLQVFSEALTSIAGGFLAAQSASLPLVVGAFFAFLGASVFLIYRRRKRLI